MQCSFITDGDALVACPSGRIDTITYNDFKTALNAELDKTKAKHLVIDLTDLEYVSSAGFREFFEIAQFMTAYAVHDTREAALAATKAA